MNDGFFGVPAEPIVPRAWIYLTSNFNVPNSSTTTETPFTTQGDILFDTHGFKNPDRHGLTIPHGFGGLYRVESRCYFLTNGANHRGIFVRRMPIFGGAFHVSGHFYLHNGGAGIPAPGCMSVTLEQIGRAHV